MAPPLLRGADAPHHPPPRLALADRDPVVRPIRVRAARALLPGRGDRGLGGGRPRTRCAGRIAPDPAALAGDFELCSDAAGFGVEQDQYRYLVRRAAGDFVFEAELLAIDTAGMAGVAARWDERSADAAHVRIAVHTTAGGFEVRSGLRLANGGMAIIAPDPIRVALPVWLRVERSGSTASAPVLDWDDQGTCCDPPPPGPGTKLKAPPPPLRHGTAFVPIPSNCEGDTSGNLRRFVWCEFEKVVRTSQGTGLPRWESYVPLTNLLQGPNGIVNVEHPNDRTTGEKSVMFSTDSFYEAVEHGYNIPCRAAARAYYCFGSKADWMPPFSTPQRVVKTFWRRDEKLPPSLDPDELYNYVDPNGVRQNLVGMHLAISQGSIFEYWTWSTFFAPRFVDEQHAKDGTPLQWNDACTVGQIADRPVEIPGVWQTYFMCTDHAPGEERCGNPWGPTNECKAQSCEGCHESIGFVALPDKQSNPSIAMAWLPSLTDWEVAECFDAIKESNDNDGVELYKSIAPEECQ